MKRLAALVLVPGLLAAAGAPAQKVAKPDPTEMTESLGDGGPATAAPLSPYSLVVDSAGNLLLADYGNASPVELGDRANRIRKVDGMTGILSTVAKSMFTSGGEVDIALDAAGNLLVADAQGGVIRRVDMRTGVVSTIAGGQGPGYAGDGGPASAAQMDHPSGVAADAAGNIYVADYGNNRIRKISADTGIMTTIAGNGSSGSSGDGGSALDAGLAGPWAVAVDASGNVFTAEWITSTLGRVRKIERSTGIITTAAGGGSCEFPGDGGPPATSGLCAPSRLTFDAGGNLYIADIQAQVVRKISAVTGSISTVAGIGPPASWGGGFSGDGGPATSAHLNDPFGLAADAAGNVYISDTYNNRVRRVDARTGIITTVAGNGVASKSTDRVTPVPHRRPARPIDR